MKSSSECGERIPAPTEGPAGGDMLRAGVVGVNREAEGGSASCGALFAAFCDREREIACLKLAMSSFPFVFMRRKLLARVGSIFSQYIRGCDDGGDQSYQREPRGGSSQSTTWHPGKTGSNVYSPKV